MSLSHSQSNVSSRSNLLTFSVSEESDHDGFHDKKNIGKCYQRFVSKLGDLFEMEDKDLE